MVTRTDLKKFLKSLKVKEGDSISLKDFPTDAGPIQFSKSEGEEMIRNSITQLSKMQDMLYAESKHSFLIVLQAMDAAGKDGAIKHVLTGLNPTGVKVSSFKAPSHLELDHDYFWRHYLQLPARGDITIFNRSHYENVLVTRVHPELLLSENIPGISSVKNIRKSFWKNRFKQINRFEKNLHENGTIVLKFFLHVSKGEQKKRFLERIDNPAKNWKFSPSDILERKHWQDYQKAYEEMISNTSTSYAPWHILPADDKWFTRLCLSSIIFSHFQKLNLSYPSLSESKHNELMQAKALLLAETD